MCDEEESAAARSSLAVADLVDGWAESLTAFLIGKAVRNSAVHGPPGGPCTFLQCVAPNRPEIAISLRKSGISEILTSLVGTGSSVCVCVLQVPSLRVTNQTTIARVGGAGAALFLGLWSVDGLSHR